MFKKVYTVYKYLFTQSRPVLYEKVDAESEEYFLKGNQTRIKKAAKKSSRILLAFLTLSNIALFVASVYVRSTSNAQPPELNAALKATSLYSPLLEEVEVSMFPLEMNGTIWPTAPLSIGRQPPSRLNDAAWGEFEKIRVFPITREDIIKLNKVPEHVARFDNDFWGLGDNAYMATLDLQHQIHCLNSLRIAAFANIPGYKPAYRNAKGDPLPNTGRDHWNHLGHCVDQLLQKLKCFGNTDIVTMEYMAERKGMPWADFNLKHQCRNYDTIMAWLDKKGVDMDKFNRNPAPKKGTFVWPSPKFSELGRPMTKEHQETWTWDDVPDPKPENGTCEFVAVAPMPRLKSVHGAGGDH